MNTPYKEFWSAQTSFLHSSPGIDVDMAVYQGGQGSGKTFIGSLLGLILSMKNPGNTGLVCGKEGVLIRDTTLVTYKEHLEAFGWTEGVDWIWHASENKMTFPPFGNSCILFRNLQSPEKIKSLNLAWIHVEEMSQITEADFLMLIGRLRQPGVKRYRLFGTTNPEPSKGWLFKHFVTKAGLQVVDLPTGEQIKIMRRRVLAPTTDNKALPASYIQNMKEAYDENYYRQMVLGQDVEFRDGLVVKNWTLANEDSSIQYNPRLPVYVTCDFNVDPMCWALAHRVTRPHDGKSEYHFFDELCVPTVTTHECAQLLAERYKDHAAGVIITGDASGNARRVEQSRISDVNYRVIQNVLGHYGIPNVVLNVPRANPAIVTRVETWCSLVKSFSHDVRIKVNPDKCKWLTWNMHNLKYVPGGEGVIIHEPSPSDLKRDVSNSLKYTKHIFDAASYLVVQHDYIKLSPALRPKNLYRESTFVPTR